MTEQKNSSKSSQPAKQEQGASSKGPRMYKGYAILGVDELKRRGIDTSDELVISLGRPLKPVSRKKDKERDNG